MKAYVKDENDKWKIDIDEIRLFFKNIVVINNDDEENEKEDESVVEQGKNVVMKVEELLNVSEEFVKLKFVHNKLVRLIEKKCRELCCGKLTCKAKYQYIAIDPISYMNFAIYRQQGDNGLDKGEFYTSDCQEGDIRTIARNPLCAYSEIHNVKFIRNEFLDKWLGLCRELIYFNQKSDILALMSSADCDGDASTVIENELIKNAVVVPQDGKYFINTDDGHKEMMIYNSENRFIATYRAAGNLIGKISLKAAMINSNSQETLDYYDTVNKAFISYSKYKHECEYKIKSDEFKKSKNKFIKEKVDSKEWITIWKSSEDFIINLFLPVFTVINNTIQNDVCYRMIVERKQNQLLKQYMEKYFNTSIMKELIETFIFSELCKLLGELDIEFFALCYFPKYFDRQF